MRVVQAFVASFVVAGLAAACAQFSSGECTDKALCDPNETSTNDTTTPDAPVDVNIDTFVGPDGNVPDGECNGGAEDCANGKDDNCNGLVDCEDPVCKGAGYVCTEPPPTGWNGPVAFVTAAGGTIPSCSGAYATAGSSGHFGLTAPAATCGCACGTPQNVSCNTGIDVTYYTDSSCSTMYGGAGLPSVGFCVSTGDPSVVATEGKAQPTAYNGDCTATPSKNVPATSWSNSSVACTYDAPSDTGGCTTGGLCVQSPSGGAWAKPCIWQTGDVTCPSGTYTNHSTFYTSQTDNRSCATCTCTATAGTCTGNIDVYNAPSCGGTKLASITTNSACTPTAAARSAVATSITTNPGTCNNNGTGGPTGSASAAGPVTVCCAP
jgi:hypothetical protein